MRTPYEVRESGLLSPAHAPGATLGPFQATALFGSATLSSFAGTAELATHFFAIGTTEFNAFFCHERVSEF